jgi:thiol-disulfide isomerase/thioredoxin
LLLAGLAASIARAEALDIGSPAPALDIEHWFHDHDPVTAFEPGTTYVVEFWATWCGPCVASIPHLAEIQKRHADDLVVISVSDEDPEVIETFLDREQGDAPLRETTSGYRLTTDPDGSTKNDYMRAAGQRGIPTAFIVGKTGQIEWIGHPMRMDEPVAKVISGEWDRAAFAAELEEDKRVRERTRGVAQLIQENRFTDAIAAFDAVIADVESDSIRQRLEQGRQRIVAQAEAFAERQRREQARAERAGMIQAETVSRLLEIAFLLETGQRAEAAHVLERLIDETKIPAVKAELEAALARLQEAAEPAGGEQGPE